jgi:hypothetical protein
MITILITLAFLLTSVQGEGVVTVAQKQDFIALLKSLPTKGESYTEESVEKAESHVPVLLALTEKDLAGYDIYPFAAISRGLCDRLEIRKYAILHFKAIQHPELKLFWGAMLFDSGSSSPEVSSFLRGALKSKEQTKILSEITGPNFEDFKRRVLAP